MLVNAAASVRIKSGNSVVVRNCETTRSDTAKTISAEALSLIHSPSAFLESLLKNVLQFFQMVGISKADVVFALFMSS